MASSSASSGGPTTYHGLDPITGETHQPAHTNSGAHTTQDTTTNGTHTTDDAGAPNDTGKPTSTPDTDATTHHGQNGDDPNAHGNGSENDSHEGNHDSSDGSDSPSSDHSSDGSSSQGGEGSSEQTSPDGTIDPDKVPSPPPDPGHSAYNDTAVNEWAQNTSKATGMTPEGALGVYDYTTNDGYHTMNPALRGAPDTPIPSNVQTRIDNTLSGMNQLPEVSATTYRGTNVPDDVYTHLQTGTGEYTDKAFMSSSYNESVAANFQSGSKNSVVFEINGNSGVDVSKLSAYGGEAEILFKPGTTFSISESSLDEQNILRVKLAEK
ncbi:ADP-ribosyltransferase [Actinomyces sp. oral taxon 448]|uniref:ADP-ribosyltransferase n=1 Tax=Actinomyces sp. oral taxon 448 TaxID=712124 RepID=UPI0002D5046D|nr:ADP-ribosyltransferase [Actinomyces sp. oral taxon 448]